MRDIVGHFLQPAHQSLDALQHGVQVGGQPVELVARAGDGQTAGQVPSHDGLSRVGHRVNAVEHAPADENAACNAKDDDDRYRPAPGVGDDLKQPLTLIEIAADEQTKTAGQL